MEISHASDDGIHSTKYWSNVMKRDLFHTYWDLHRKKKSLVKFVRNSHPSNRKSERPWKYIVRPIRDTNFTVEATSARGNKMPGRRSAKSCSLWRNNRWLNTWARKQKYESKHRERRKIAKTVSSKEGRLKNSMVHQHGGCTEQTRIYIVTFQC